MTDMVQEEKLVGKDVLDIEGISLVSIIIPTRNRPDFLKAALQSVCAQTYRNFEIIVINDGGEDVSGIIKDFRDKCRIEYISLLTGKGPAASRNEGIKRAEGKYIAYLDDDDIFYPNHLELLIDILERDNCSVVYADSYQAFQRPEGGRYETYDKKLVYSEDFNRQRLLIMNYIRTENIVHRRECIAEVGMFDESLNTHEDWDLWIRLSCKYEFRHIRTVTAEFRTRVKSEGITASNRPDFLRTMKIIHSRYSDYATDPDIRRKQKYVEAELENEIMLKAQFELQSGSYSIEKAKTGKSTFRIMAEDGNYKTLHSLYDPEAEARTLVNSFKFDGKGILVILGLGLGYHVAELAGRFADAEILVIEAYPEIYELAEEHGPAINSRVRFITGLAHQDALRQITEYQIKKGLTPLSVFALSSAVAAFPGYYRPILDALNKTVSVKLWDRIRYSKFKLNALKVVLFDTGYFLVREVESGLKSLGHKVTRVPVASGAKGESVIAGIIESILDFRPDFIITMNHLGFDEEGVLIDFLKSIEMPVASWYVDSPRLIVQAFDKNVSPWMSLFLWDSSYMKDMEAMGFESIIYLPLGTDENLFKPIKSNSRFKIQNSRYSCDVGFVGNSMVGPVKEWMEKVDKRFHPLIEKLAEEYAGSNNINDEDKTSPIKKLSDDTMGLSLKEKMDLEAAILWKATLLYRLSCVEMLKEFNVNIYGDSEWRELLKDKNYSLFPPLNYYKELPLLYSSCKINFNATSRQMREAVNQRVFDVPACGAFLLTDYQKSLDELFEVGKEIITYRSKDEIPGLVRFYLNNPNEREAVAKRGRERVLKEHTYKHRLKVIIDAMKERYS